MTTTYTKVNKATGTTYTNVSTGALLYDDKETTYDSSTNYFDGIFSLYTNVVKAAGTVYTKVTKAT